MIVITYEDKYQYPREDLHNMLKQTKEQVKNIFKDEEVFCLPDCLTIHKDFTREQLLSYKIQFDTMYEIMKNELDKEGRNK